jgi:hypothetical protein
MLLAFIAGSITNVGLRVAHQDYLGLDGWLERVKDGWVDLPVGVGILVVVVGLGLYSYVLTKALKAES